MAGAGYKLFATGDVLTAAQVNTYLMQQTTMVFASSAARTTALSGVIAEGMLSYLTDTNALQYYDGAAWQDVSNPGDITGVTAGTGLSGGGTSGSVTLSIDTATTVDKTTAQTLTNKTLTAPVINLAFNAQTGTTYTLVAADSGKLVTTSNASAVTVTIPPSVFTAGEQINLQSIGVGLTSFAQGAGVTITSTGATASAPTLRARYSAATIICTASNTFTVIGDLS
jgi:hypothetical protein